MLTTRKRAQRVDFMLKGWFCLAVRGPVERRSWSAAFYTWPGGSLTQKSSSALTLNAINRGANVNFPRGKWQSADRVRSNSFASTPQTPLIYRQLSIRKSPLWAVSDRFRAKQRTVPSIYCGRCLPTLSFSRKFWRKLKSQNTSLKFIAKFEKLLIWFHSGRILILIIK